MLITPEEVDGKIGFGCDITGMISPAQIVVNGNTYILTVLCYFKYLDIQ
jgi:hypothetical protein